MGDGGREAVRLREKTAASFGFEWMKFSEVFAAYESNFLSYIDVSKEFFRDKLVLDAGCGAGRHAYFAEAYGARVVAFDLSDKAVEAARRNLEHSPNASVTQGDIYSFTYPEKFDYIVCLGVLHHLPDPQGGFDRLVSLLKPGGVLSIWVYGKRDNRLATLLYEPTRRITTHLPHRMLYLLSFPLALAVEALNRLRMPLFRHYACFPFRTKWNDAFDVFSAPLARYYTLDEIRGWYQQAGLTDIKVSYRVLDGAVKGIKGFGRAK